MIDLDISDARVDLVNPIDDFKGKSVRYTFPVEFNEAELFSLLLWKFKNPNGPMTMFLPPGGDSDAPFKWDYVFGFPSEIKIHIQRSVNDLEVSISPKTVSREDFLKFIENNIKIYRKEIYETLASLEDYTLLINPYKRHSSIADLAAKELSKISYKAPSRPPHGSSKKEVKRYYNDYERYLENRERETLYSMMLVSESAFKVESYINMILAFLMKDKVKNDKNLFEETMRRGWKKKLQHLFLDCNHIVEKAEIEKDKLTEIEKLFSMRNKIAHSYPDKKDLEVAKMWFWENYPILKNPIPFNVFQVGINNKLPTRAEALELKSIADEFIESLNSFIDPKIHKSFKLFVNANPLGYNESKKMYSVPFGEAVIIGMNFR